MKEINQILNRTLEIATDLTEETIKKILNQSRKGTSTANASPVSESEEQLNEIEARFHEYTFSHPKNPAALESITSLISKNTLSSIPLVNQLEGIVSLKKRALSYLNQSGDTVEEKIKIISDLITACSPLHRDFLKE